MKYAHRVLFPVLLIVLLLVGCSVDIVQSEQLQEEDTGTGYLTAERGNYNSIDTAIVVRYDLEDASITLRNIEIGKDYTLTYNFDTTITNQYNEIIAMNQIEIGDIVDVTFMKEQKWLNTITISSNAWKYTNITNFRIEELQDTLYVSNDLYRLYGNVVAVSKERFIELMEINIIDQITIKGIGQTVYSISVEQGHGYLRLENTDYFVGGWVEIGKDLICPITENMLLVVAEGFHEVRISKEGISGVRPITIIENQETKFDVSEFNGEETQTGQVVFTVTPYNATVIINGEEINTSEVVELDYGIHQMLITAEGYQSISQFLKVGEAIASVSIVMEEIGDDEDTTEEDENVGEEEDDTTEEGDDLIGGGTIDGYTVKIEAPEGAQVYLNGSYIGVAPISFEKVKGVHSIILKQDGYEMRTHTITIDDEEKDVSYAFSELTPSD